MGKNVLPDDEYEVEVENCYLEDGPKWVTVHWSFRVLAGPHAGTVVPYSTQTSPHALWLLREVLVALGVDVPTGKGTITPSHYIGRRCAVYVKEGRPRDFSLSQATWLLDLEKRVGRLEAALERLTPRPAAP